MQFVSPTYQILSYPSGREITRFIEKVARTCYKSEHKIKEGSDLSLIQTLVKNDHLAMIEFGHDIVVKFISNRGFSHELVRHRLASFAQESTRYCNYNKDKFGNAISVTPMEPEWLNLGDTNKPAAFRAMKLFNAAYAASEDSYLKLVKMGVPAQIAREVLPIGLKAEICIKTNIREWRHILRLRCSKKAHPRMRQLMIPLLHELHERIPLLFDDLAEKYPIGRKDEIQKDTDAS